MQHKSIFVSKISFSVLIILALYACSNSTETRSGVKVNFLKKGGGEEVKGGNYLLVNMLFKDQKDSVWKDTKKEGNPVIIQSMDSVAKGDMTNEVFHLLKKGDSVTFQVSAKNLFERTLRSPLPPTADSTTQFTFHVGLVDVMTFPQVQKYQMHQDSVRHAKSEKDKVIQLGKDTVTIDNFLKEKNIAALKTKSGLRYIITQPGKGENAKEGQQVKVHYTGRLMDGKVFDTSVESVAKANNKLASGRNYDPLTLTVGMHQVIPGWEEGVGLMNKGSKMTLYIPSTLAYGDRPMGHDLAPNSILVFDMDLIDITTPQAPKVPKH